MAQMADGRGKARPAVPVLTGFAASPDGGRGLARDMRVRWALEEVGQPYDMHLLSFAQMKEAGHLAHHPFGQIPSYHEGDLVLFESGAIVLHVAQTRPGLLPSDRAHAARAVSWLFAALNTVEPVTLERETAFFHDHDKPWYAARQEMIDTRIRTRLSQVAQALGGQDWLEGSFTLGDLMMIAVLWRLMPSGLVSDFPTLAAYVARGQERPAFQRAFAAQRAVFQASQDRSP